MKNTSAIAILAALAPCLAGCGSMRVERVAACSDDVCGLRVQIAESHHTLAIIESRNGKPIERSSIRSLPSPDEHYELDFRGALFTQREIVVELHGNGTLKRYFFTTDANLDEIASSAGTLATKTAEALKTLEEPKVDPLEKANADLEKQIVADMLAANKEAAKQGLPLPYPFLFQ